MDTWLTKKMTINEAESLHMVKDERLGNEPVPFGFINDCWKELLSMMKDGDELWEFCSPEKTWVLLMGCEGIALIRKGKIVTYIVTREN